MCQKSSFYHLHWCHTSRISSLLRNFTRLFSRHFPIAFRKGNLWGKSDCWRETSPIEKLASLVIDFKWLWEFIITAGLKWAKWSTVLTLKLDMAGWSFSDLLFSQHCTAVRIIFDCTKWLGDRNGRQTQVNLLPYWEASKVACRSVSSNTEFFFICKSSHSTELMLMVLTNIFLGTSNNLQLVPTINWS